MFYYWEIASLFGWHNPVFIQLFEILRGYQLYKLFSNKLGKKNKTPNTETSQILRKLQKALKFFSF